ncbi:MAG: glycosyltransferase family 2 protein [Chloroflexota bacterium]
MSQFRVSVIIPNYNRKENILRLLPNLMEQTLPADQFEVIVVDDGSSYDPAEILAFHTPFKFQFLRKENQGATIARNFGVDHSSGNVLIFIDDDVTLTPPTLEAMAKACESEEKAVVMGTIVTRFAEENPSHFTQLTLENANSGPHAGHNDDKLHDIHFSWCNTELLAVCRADFFALGMLQDPTGGWPNWDDVDFGYRSYKAGYRLLQCGGATGFHWDYSIASLEKACIRWQKAGVSAVKLYQVHPELREHIVMFKDKTPIEWGQDSPKLIMRKIIYRILASPPIVWLMETVVKLLETVFPSKKLLGLLYRWIQGSYMLRGYRLGLSQ